MGFDNTPVKPLGKIWTLKMVVNTIILWLRKETQSDLDPEFVKTLVNVAVTDVAEFISGVGSDDYGKIADITDIGGSIANTLVLSATYTNSTRTITKTSHGLTSADIGKRIVYFQNIPFEAQGVMCIAEVESITDANNFTVTKALGRNISTGEAIYAIFPPHSEMAIDLSNYRIANITKITDSINKEVIKVGDTEFENLARFDERQNKVYWYKHGQTLYLYKGQNVANIGTLKMYYNSYPQLFTDDDSNLDIRDNYVPLVISTAKNYCLEHLGMQPAESLSNIIDNKKREIRENILREKGVIYAKNTGAKKEL